MHGQMGGLGEQVNKEHMLKNPDFASKIESTLRLLSYVLPGRFGTSEAIAELVYSALHNF